VAAPVTPCRHHADPTVLDEYGRIRARASAMLDGDVLGTNQIPVPLELAVGAAELAAFGLGHTLPAGRAGGGAATLIHEPHLDAGLLGLVAQRLRKVGAAPLPQAEILRPAGILAGDALGVADQQGPDPLSDGEGDHLLGGLVMCLVDATAVTGLDLPDTGPVAAPSA
jgi:hypothetical protein